MSGIRAESYTIQSLPEEERPRERFLKQGAESISTTELIAILLGSGMRGKSVVQLAQELLVTFGTLRKLADATIEELCQIKGLGIAKAIQLKASFTLGLRASQQMTQKKYRVEQPVHAYQLLKDQLQHEKREHFMIIMLDVKGYVINFDTISIGTLSRSLIHPREVFYPAIRHKAATVVLAHNHPSGDPTPSQEDIEVTEKLVSVGSLLGIPVKDHIIIGENTFVSMRQKGFTF
jgi:DNA repair protein RadC